MQQQGRNPSTLNSMQGSRQKFGPQHPELASKVQRQSHNNQNSRQKTNHPSSKRGVPSPTSGIKMPPHIPSVQLDRPFVSSIRQNPVLHKPPNFSRGATENALTRSRCLTNQSNIRIREPSSLQKIISFTRDTLEIVCI